MILSLLRLNHAGNCPKEFLALAFQSAQVKAKVRPNQVALSQGKHRGLPSSQVSFLAPLMVAAPTPVLRYRPDVADYESQNGCKNVERLPMLARFRSLLRQAVAAGVS